jgi:hypothetical protein
MINTCWRAAACLVAAAVAHDAARAQAVAWTAPIEAYSNVEAALLDTATAPDGATAVLLQAGGSREELRVVLYDAGAAVRWQATFPPDCRPSRDSGGGASEIAFGADGDVYVAANSGFSDVQCTMRVARADGRIVWRHRDVPDNTPMALLHGYDTLAFDPAGNVLVAGERNRGALVRLTQLDGATGALRWSHDLTTPAGARFDGAYRLVTDAAGNAYVAWAYSRRNPAGIGGVVVARVDASGIETWQQTLPGYADLTLRCEQMRYTALALVAETTLMVGSNCADISLQPTGRRMLARLRAADGAIVWRQESDGHLNSLTAGPAGELFAVIRTNEPYVGLGRLDPMTGAVLWKIDGSVPRLHYLGNGKALQLDAQPSGQGLSLSTSELDLATGVAGAATVVEAEVPYESTWALSGNGAHASVVRVVARTVQGWRTRQTVDVTAYVGTAAGAGSSAPTRAIRHAQFPLVWRRAIAVAGNGVISAAIHPIGQFDFADGAIVVKRDTMTGRERWRRVYDRDSAQTWSIKGVAGLPGGDVAFIGSADLMVRLDGATGVERWRVPMPDAYSDVNVIGADPAGDLVVLAVGKAQETWIAKHAAADGAERWRVELPSGGTYAAQNGQVRFAANGDVFVVSFREVVQWQPHYYAARLRGSDGVTLWHTEFDAALPNAKAVDAATIAGTDLVIAGSRGEAAWAARLDGASGSVRWSVEHAALQRASRVLVDADGGIVLTTNSTSRIRGWRIARLAADDGALAWYRELPLGPTRDSIFDLAQAPDGTLLFSGECQTTALCITGLSPHDGTDRWSYSQPLTGGNEATRIVKDLAFDARGNLVVNAYANTASTPDDGVTAAQMRILGPWSQDLFTDGFD